MEKPPFLLFEGDGFFGLAGVSTSKITLYVNWIVQKLRRIPEHHIRAP